MSTPAVSQPISPLPLQPAWSLADLQDHLGGIPLSRIRLYPSPGLATERDLCEAQHREGRLFELVDGVLVEKAMGYYESIVAGLILHAVREYLNHHDLGVVLGADGTLRILPNQIREPDVTFLSWRHFPQRILPRDPIPAIAPDLAVEVLSAGNTAAEMERKLREYFQAGTKLVWYVDPASFTVTVYESLENATLLTNQDVLRGGEVLPGFELSVGELFRRAGQRD